MNARGFATILIPILIILFTVVIGGFLYIKSPLTQLIKEKFTPKPVNQTTSTEQTPTHYSTPAITIKTDLPKIVERSSSSIPSFWKEYSDSRGYKFSYPSNWFIKDYEGKAQQVQNWDPKSVKRTGPLSGDQSKWDVGFSSKSFNSTDELLSSVSGGIRVDKIEKSKTVNNQVVYFIESTSSFFGNEDVRVPVILATTADSNKYFTWYGIYSGSDKEAEILKQIVESIR